MNYLLLVREEVAELAEDVAGEAEEGAAENTQAEIDRWLDR